MIDTHILLSLVIKQQRSLQKKYGAVENDLSDDSDQKEKQKASFTRGRQYLYGADNIDFEVYCV